MPTVDAATSDRNDGPRALSLAPILEVSGLSKRFGGIQALEDVQLDVRAGEVMALIGENGAGKSTLVKILTGIYQPDAGAIKLAGISQTFANAHLAAVRGITAIHQEPAMFEDLTVAENIMVGQYPRSKVFGAIDWRAMTLAAAAHLEEIGADIDPSSLVAKLGVAERHMVTIARALAQKAKVVIFDEPTAALSRHEIEYLFAIVRKLKASGKALIFISHKFDEVFAIADRYTVLRDGRFVARGDIAGTTQSELVRMMVGRQLDREYPKANVDVGEVILDVRGLSHPTEFRDVTFTLRKREILGVYGLVGAGRTEVMEAIFGLKAVKYQAFTINGRPAAIRNPDDAIAAGIAYVPEDRQQHGAILSMSVSENISLVSLGALSRGPFLNPRGEEELAEFYGRQVSIKAASWAQAVGELSGGNQQKVVVSKWLASKPDIVIFDEPTKGIDIGSKIAVHSLVAGLVTTGVSVILVSSELEEVLGLSDRILVMRRGLVRGCFERAAATREDVVKCASGAA